MRKDFFEYPPTHKLWLCANHRPAVRGTDHAIWRRICLIPFNVQIPDREKDPDLPEKLKDELPGILNWAIDGCLAWQRRGLSPPETVQLASNDYRSEQDLVGQFLEKWTVFDRKAQAPTGDLYSKFKEHCEAVGERNPSQKIFGGRLGDRPGLRSVRTRDGIVWHGLRLRDLNNPSEWGE